VIKILLLHHLAIPKGGINLGRILFIKNKQTIDPELQKEIEALEKKHTFYLEDSIWDGQTTAEKNYIDLVILQSDLPMEGRDEVLFDNFLKACNFQSVLLFISEKADSVLQKDLQKYDYSYVTPSPINQEQFQSLVKKCLSIADSLDLKKIVCYENNLPFHIRAKDILYTYRDGKHMDIVYRDPEKPWMERSKRFFDRRSLGNWIKHHEIEKYLTQCHKKYLVSPAHIESIDFTNKIITLENKTTVPLGDTYAKGFR